MTFYSPIETFPEKRFKLMFEVQVWAAVHLSQLVLPSMRERKSGAIVNISSGAAIHPKKPYVNVRAGGTVYGMCKAALERFSTGLASEVYRRQRLRQLHPPGLVATPGVAVHGLITEKTKDSVTPIENIAQAVLEISARPEGDDRPHRQCLAFPQGAQRGARHARRRAVCRCRKADRWGPRSGAKQVLIVAIAWRADKRQNSSAALAWRTQEA